MTADADLLRRAATLMRERAQAATPGPWWSKGVWFHRVSGPDGTTLHIPHPTVGHGSTGADLVAYTIRKDGNDAEHIAAADPPFMLTVADWLDATAAEHESASGNPHVDSFFAAFDTAPDVAALATATAYLDADA